MHFSTLAGKHWSKTNRGYVHDFDNSCIKTCACKYLFICQFWPSPSSVNQWTNKFPIHLTHSYLIICLPYWITLTFNFTGPTGPSLWGPRFCEDLGQVWEATTPSGRWCETTAFLRLSEFDDVRKVRNQQPSASWNYHAKGCKKHQQILRTLTWEILESYIQSWLDSIGSTFNISSTVSGFWGFTVQLRSQRTTNSSVKFA